MGLREVHTRLKSSPSRADEEYSGESQNWKRKISPQPVLIETLSTNVTTDGSNLRSRLILLPGPAAC